jgi:hypothetical protein
VTRLRRSLIAGLGPPAVRALARSWRIEVVGGGGEAPVFAGSQPYVLLCWHDALLPVMWYHRRRGIAALISEARDGQYLASLAASLGYRLIRGSTTRGARGALLGAVKALKRGVSIGVTPDGPQGPRRVAKPGAIAAAARGGGIVVPVHAEARPAWRAGSWDRFLVPGPFARVRMAYGQPFEVSPGAEAEAAALSRVARELAQAVRLAEWPDGAVIPTV